MKYERPAYGDPSVRTKKALAAFGPGGYPLPAFDTPISVRENFFRVARRDHPLWIPLAAAEMQELHMSHLYDKGPEGYQLGPNLGETRERYTYLDEFGNSWTFDRNAGGACMTIGTRVCDDILQWERQIKFPDLHEWNLDERAERFLREEHDPERVLNMDIYHGPFQAMADLLGGFAEALEAMFVEPEASAAFLNRYADWLIWLIDRLSGLYPADIFTIHDDWGTEKDAFFSPAMMEDLLFEPTKRIIDHVHSLGKLYTFHCCGKVDKFLPAMCDLGADFLQLQRRVNDTPAYKRMYGDRIGFNVPFDGLTPGKRDYTDEQLREIVRRNVDDYGANGGFVPLMVSGTPQAMWTMASELYCYSREKLEQA